MAIKQGLDDFLVAAGPAGLLPLLVAAAAVRSSGADGGSKSRRKSVATRLVEMATDAGVELFHTPDGVPYATAPVAGHAETYMVHSTVFRQFVSRLYYAQENAAANASAVSDALNVLAAQAKFDGPMIPVHTRVAEHQGSIYLDLADTTWRAIEITPAVAPTSIGSTPA